MLTSTNYLLCIYIYIDMYSCTCIHTYIYIYLFIYERQGVASAENTVSGAMITERPQLQARPVSKKCPCSYKGRYAEFIGSGFRIYICGLYRFRV